MASPGPAGPPRAVYAAAAVFLQILLGVLYSWSVFRPPLSELHGWSKAQTIAPYRFSMLAFAAGMIFAGFWQDRKGPRLVASAGGLLLALGCVFAGAFGHRLEALIAGYGIIAGLGMGFAYVTPIAMCVKWFPDRRGFIVGLAVMGFGVGPLLFGPLIESLIGNDPSRYAFTIPRTFYILAAVFLIGVVGAAQLYRVPPPGWHPPGWQGAARAAATLPLAPAEALRTWQFPVLWIVYFLGTSVGLTAIGEASPLLREKAGPGTWLSAGAALGVMSVFNGLGRLGWGAISDRFSRKTALLGMGAGSVAACLGFLRTADSFAPLLAGLCLAAFCYGGYLALMPSLTADYFGARHVGANYGLLFSAWGLCGFFVPGYFAALMDRAKAAGQLANGYAEVYTTLAALAAVCALAALILRPPLQPQRS
jgi:OFA family oxalate/formate antiporter-like MFS transporter